MDDNRSTKRLSSLISKLTVAANKAVKKENAGRKFSQQRSSKAEFQVPLNLTPIEQNLRTS